jgi:aminoglycoside phosphotransferase (APT) family kinase protein
MTTRRMHDDQIDVDEAVVRELLRRQLPQWANQPLTRVASQGTVNAIYRLGSELVVRLPLTPRWHDIDLEACWLAALAPRLPVRIPEVVAIGDADDAYPWKWGVLRWLDGSPWRIENAVDAVADAELLAQMISTLAAIDPRSLPCGKPDRRGSLQQLDDATRATVDSVRHLINGDAFLAAWEDAVTAPDFDGKPPLSHGDLLAGNVLMHAGRLHAVIDWAGTCRADPAREVMVAWTLLAGDARIAFRHALDVDDLTWRRAKGWALTRIFNVGYYEHSNPVFSADARRTIEEVLRD